jgi:hypothetical protein
MCGVAGVVEEDPPMMGIVDAPGAVLALPGGSRTDPRVETASGFGPPS